MMEKQQKILDMAKDICRVKLNCNDVCNPISACDALRYAERAVEAGYVKVVRCKECKHHRDLDGGVKCERIDGLLMTLPNDYCSYGERKDNE